MTEPHATRLSGALWPRAVRLVGAVLGGLALWLAFPDANLWWLAPVGCALIAAAAWGVGARAAALLGLIAGLSLYIPTLSWSGIYVGKTPWFALSLLEALYLAAALAAWALLQRLWGARGRSWWLAWAFAPIWVLGEWSRSLTPFGGFPWARLAFSQGDSPLLPGASVGGAPWLSMVVALLGVALWQAVRLVLRSQVRAEVLVAAFALALACMNGAVPLPTDGRAVSLGVVQGNVPQAGLEFNAQRQAVLNNHVAATRALARSFTEATKPEAILWPENSSDLDPFRESSAAQAINDTVKATGIPLLVGAVLQEPAGRLTNASLLYRPGTSAPPERYVKQHPAPFAEYIPFRSFFRFFSKQVDLVRSDFIAGKRPVAFTIGAGERAWWLAPVICVEVAYDDLVRESVAAAQGEPSLLVVQTNNATFGYSAESTQQLAMSQLRAVEHGRSVVQVSTMGVSAVIAPDGSISHRTGLFEQKAFVAQLPVRQASTLSDRLPGWANWFALAWVAALAGVGFSLRRRRA